MKKFKLYDYWISVTLIGLSVIYGIIADELGFIAGYFVVGAWHIISLLVHHYNNWFTEKGGSRRVYQTIVIFLCVAFLAGIIVAPVLYVLMFVLLLAAPLMAIYYTRLCYKEVYIKMQRPLAMLK